MKRLAFLVSGNGSNMANLIRRIKKGEIRRAEAALVISNKPDVKALGRALEFGVPSVVISHGDYDSRESFDEALSECLDRHKIDLVCLCGFMRILTEGFVRKYYGRLVNTHPSFLPDFPGPRHQGRVERRGQRNGCDGPLCRYGSGYRNGDPPEKSPGPFRRHV